MERMRRYHQVTFNPPVACTVPSLLFGAVAGNDAPVRGKADGRSAPISPAVRPVTSPSHRRCPRIRNKQPGEAGLIIEEVVEHTGVDFGFNR
jgi:hypothetical protein